MKNIVVALIALVSLAVIPSCKKGENDPFISLRSRDARITGKWKIVNFEEISNFNGSIHSSILNGSILTETSNGSSSSYSYSAYWEILADGIFKYTSNIDGELSNGSGNWYWLNDTKKKTKIFINDEEIFVVDRLTNNELILKYQYGESDLYNGSNNVSSYALTITLEKE